MGILRRPSDDLLGYMDLVFIQSCHRLGVSMDMIGGDVLLSIAIRFSANDWFLIDACGLE